LIVTMEKRINFSMSDLQAKAHAYDYFREHFRGDKQIPADCINP